MLRPWSALLLLALGTGACVSASPPPPTSADDLAAASSEHPERELPLPADGEPFGSAEGRVVLNGEPLAGCRVRAVLLRPASGLFSGRYQGGEMVEVSTDAAGQFRFELLPIGSYTLKWWIPGDTHWIRTLSPEPDFAVKAGQTATLRPIEAGRRIVGY